MDKITVAKLCHEINRAYCISLGDNSQVSWEQSPEWQRKSAVNGVEFHLANPDATFEDSHNSWLKEKVEDGWTFGWVKDPVAKTHPCCVPYSELPKEQQMKDQLFSTVIKVYRDWLAGNEVPCELNTLLHYMISLHQSDPRVEIKYLPHYYDAFTYQDSIPDVCYATDESAGLDIRAAIKDPVVVRAGGTVFIRSGIAIDINNKNTMFQIVPRSGLGSKHGIILGNGTGIIDSDYQGEIGIMIWNRSNVDFTVNPGDRVCQGVFVPVIRPTLVKVEEFSRVTERGEDGFGSSGTK